MSFSGSLLGCSHFLTYECWSYQMLSLYLWHLLLFSNFCLTFLQFWTSAFEYQCSILIIILKFHNLKVYLILFQCHCSDNNLTVFFTPLLISYSFMPLANPVVSTFKMYPWFDHSCPNSIPASAAASWGFVYFCSVL